jgi:hypothetical protein
MADEDHDPGAWNPSTWAAGEDEEGRDLVHPVPLVQDEAGKVADAEDKPTSEKACDCLW